MSSISRKAKSTNRGAAVELTRNPNLNQTTLNQYVSKAKLLPEFKDYCLPTRPRVPIDSYQVKPRIPIGRRVNLKTGPKSPIKNLKT